MDDCQRNEVGKKPTELRQLILAAAQCRGSRDSGETPIAKLIWALVKPSNMDGAGGRSMDVDKALKMTIPQAIFFLKDSFKREVSLSDVHQAIHGNEEQMREAAKRKIAAHRAKLRNEGLD